MNNSAQKVEITVSSQGSGKVSADVMVYGLGLHLYTSPEFLRDPAKAHSNAREWARSNGYRVATRRR